MPYFGIAMLLIALLFYSSTSPSCKDLPIYQPKSGLLAFHKEGMNKTTVYINPKLYQNVTYYVDIADKRIAYTAQAHIKTRQAHMGSLVLIERVLQEANWTLQTVIDRRIRHPSSEQELANLELDIKRKLNKAESKLAMLLSSRKSLIQEQNGTAFNQAEAQVNTALDSIDNFAQDNGDYGVDSLETWKAMYKRFNSIPLAGFSSNDAQYKHQLQKNAAMAQMKGAYKAGKKLLTRIEDWKSLNTQTNAKWDTIDTQMREHKQYRDSLNPEIAIRNLYDILQGSRHNLIEEIEIFMKTWGPGAGYRWKRAPHNMAGAVPCRDRDAASGAEEDDDSWWESDAA